MYFKENLLYISAYCITNVYLTVLKNCHERCKCTLFSGITLKQHFVSLLKIYFEDVKYTISANSVLVSRLLLPLIQSAYDIEWIVLHCDVTVPLNRPIMLCFIFLRGIKATESMSAGKNGKFWKCHKLLCLRQGCIHKIKGVVHVTVLTCDIQLLTVCSRLYGEAAPYWS